MLSDTAHCISGQIVMLGVYFSVSFYVFEQNYTSLYTNIEFVHDAS